MPVVPVALAVLVLGGYALYRRLDIRLVLIAAAAALFVLRASRPEVAGQRINAFAQVFVEFAKGMTRPSAVVPICSAMGFAYVCKLTGCDAHLVHLLVRPLRYVRPLLIPGGIAVAFFVNSAIVSQTSTVSVVGPVLIPLLLASGVSRLTAGSLLLLGGSMGGELLNPAAVEVAAIHRVTGRETYDIIHSLAPYNALASGTALLVFWAMALTFERRRARAMEGSGVWAHDHEETIDAVAQPGSIAAAMSATSSQPVERINVFKAMVPLVPIFLLMVVKRVMMALHLMPAVLTPVPGDANDIAEQATIGAAMLIGALCAGLSTPRMFGRLPAAFFEGAGFTYAHVISVITAAAMFAEGVRVNGLIERMTAVLNNAPHAVTVASVVVPWAMACVTGTAVGTAPLVIGILLPVAMGHSKSEAAIVTGVRLGGVNAIAAQFGRTSSPVAPVTIMCATLARTRPIELVKRVMPPLLAGGIILVLAALWMAQ